MNNTIFIFICLLFYTTGYSQNLYKGKLISALTQKPIQFGYVQFNDKLLASTDTSGNFIIDLDSTNNIPLLFFSPEVGWVAMENLHFHKDSIVVIKLTPECPDVAEKDIKENKIKLFIASGPFSPLPTKTDHDFEKKYKVEYYGAGDCTHTIATDCLVTYNQTVFLYLDKKFGKGWRNKANKNVYGL
jgi:hypothetical protein